MMAKWNRTFARALFASLGAVLALRLAYADSKETAQPQLDAAIVADRERGAFLEDAPRAVQRSMQKALNAVCAGARITPPKNRYGKPIDLAGLCGATPLRYLREVLVTGVKLSDGWICSARDFERYKYFPIEMPAARGCVLVTYDYGKKVHSIFTEGMDSAEDQATRSP